MAAQKLVFDHGSLLKFIACVAILGGGCASIISGTRQTVSFQSSPDEATVTVSGSTIGKTPVTLQLDRKSNQSVVFTKDGYKPVTMQMETMLSNWFWGNFILGGPLGSTIDALSGAVHQYSQSQYFVTLEPEGVGTESSTLKSQRDKAKEFIVSRHTVLLSELSKGGGEEIDALMQLLNIERDKQPDALSTIRGLSELFPDPTFADQMIALYLK